MGRFLVEKVAFSVEGAGTATAPVPPLFPALSGFGQIHPKNRQEPRREPGNGGFSWKTTEELNLSEKRLET